MSGRPTRRELLRASAGIVVASGPAGCLSGGDDAPDDQPPAEDPAEEGPATGDEPTDGGTKSSTPSAIACTALDDGYSHFAPGEIPMVAELDYPAGLGEMEVKSTLQIYVEARRPAADPDAESLHIGYTQLTNGKERSSIQGPGDDDRDVALTTDFGGEEVWVVSNPFSPAYNVDIQASLPYDVGGETRYFDANITLSKEKVDEPSTDCHDAMVAAARHVATSLEPNPDSTIAEEQS